MRMYGKLWELIKESTKDKPVQVRSHAGNHERIKQAVRKLKSEENRRRAFRDEPAIPHGRLIATSSDDVLSMYLEFNGDHL